ncbi:unnamed protein product [Medioppia subpectinata]|uniref:G-protein coupled receptors family 1 profile domain-containing protein n=1 Tax=Medioppia subpectinata TaxID=1979941 RepID=A0A7R9Q019_9ACAR|nr:unnamed protein product [Medioppia subpectinata]CAG2107656.1 unnamed protein product [Medioppia subpectinata]
MSQMVIKLSNEMNNSWKLEATENYFYVTTSLPQNQFYETIGADNHTLLTMNSTNNEDYMPYEDRLETYIVPLVFSIIFIVGFIGNGTLIHIFIRHKSMRNLPNTFILCLAVGDLLVIVGTVPFISLIYTLDSWPFGEFICKFSEFMRDVSIGITVLTLSVLSFDRYVAIAQPFSKINDNMSKKSTTLVVIALWIISVLLAIPGAYNSQVIRYNITNDIHINICYPFPAELGHWYPKMIVSFKFIFFYIIPLVTIGSFYALMARHLVKSSQQISGLNVNQQFKHLELRTRVAKMVFILSVIFAVCFFPNHIFMIWFYFTYPNSMENYNTFWHILKITVRELYLISGKFRSHFKRYLFGCFAKRRQLERKPTYRAKPLLFYSTSIKSSSGAIAGANSTRL